MAIVIQFPIPKRPPTGAINPSGVAAEILFFTGVRYERSPDPGASRTGVGHSASGQRPRKRKRRA